MGDHRGRGPVREAAGVEQPSGNSGAEATRRGHVCIAGQPLAQSASLGAGHGVHTPHSLLIKPQPLDSKHTGRQSRGTGRWGRGSREPGGSRRGPPLGWARGSRIFPGPIFGLIPLEPVGCRFLIFLPSQSFGQQTSVCLGPAGLTAHICLWKPPGQGRGTQDRGEGTAWRCAQQQEAARGTPGPTSARWRRPEQVREMQAWGGGRGACLDCHRLHHRAL